MFHVKHCVLRLFIYNAIQIYDIIKTLMGNNFMLTDLLGKKVHVVIDRPMGSLHPNYYYIYPLNYGYIPGTRSGDGEEIDAYILGEFRPLKEYDGIVIAVCNRLNDFENKLVVSNKIGRYSASQIAALLEFQERFFNTEIVTMP